MLIRGATEADVRAALEVADYGYHNLCFSEGPEPTSGDRLSWRLELGVEDLDGPGCRLSAPQVRRVFRRNRTRSACWHAHRDYLYALFERTPQARVTSSITSYRGFRAFLRHHPARLGVMAPYHLADACNCRKFPHLEELIPEELGGYHLDASRLIAEGIRAMQSKEEEAG